MNCIMCKVWGALLSALAAVGTMFALYAKGRKDAKDKVKQEVQKEYIETTKKLSEMDFNETREEALKRLRSKLK